MDSKKIGAFIASKRKEKQMTQKQLGEALDCSDKLISKWECGNGLPDVSMILPLCEQLEINVNELLSGESLTQESYPGKAEENMMNLIKTNEHQKKGIIKRMVSAFVLIAGIGLLLFLLSMVNVHPISFVNYLDGVGLLEMFVILVLTLWCAGRLRDFKNAFPFLFWRDEKFCETKESKALEHAVSAVALAEKSLIFGGAFTSLFYVIFVLCDGQARDTAVFYANMAVSLLTLFYGFLGAMLLAPVKSRLERKRREDF